MEQLDLEFPKTKYNFLEHVIGHDVINSWNTDQKGIEERYDCIQDCIHSIQRIQYLIKIIEERDEKGIISFEERKSLIRLNEMIDETEETIGLCFEDIDCLLRSQEHAYRHVHKRMLDEINSSGLIREDKRKMIGLSLVKTSE